MKYGHMIVGAAIIAHGVASATLADLKRQSEELRRQSEEFSQQAAAQSKAIDQKTSLNAQDKKKAKQAVNASKSSFSKMKDSFSELVSKVKGYFTKKESEIPADVRQEIVDITKRRGELSMRISNAEAQLNAELESNSKGMADRMIQISEGIEKDTKEMAELNKRYKKLAAKYTLD